MDDTNSERSAGGIPILRHEAQDRAFSPAAAGAFAEAIETHMERHFGSAQSVLHEIASDLIHVDVHLVPPSPDRDWWTLFTTGMSDLPMTVPEGFEELRYAELMIKLPTSWPLESISVLPPAPEADSENWYWPIRGLKMLARLPHDYETWLRFGHTVPNGDPPVPFAAGTDLCAWMLLPPLGVSDEARSISVGDEVVIQIYVVHALHIDELELKLDKGTNALLERFDVAGVREVLDPRRRSAIPRKRFGLFST